MCDRSHLLCSTLQNIFKNMTHFIYSSVEQFVQNNYQQIRNIALSLIKFETKTEHGSLKPFSVLFVNRNRKNVFQFLCSSTGCCSTFLLFTISQYITYSWITFLSSTWCSRFVAFRFLLPHNFFLSALCRFLANHHTTSQIKKGLLPYFMFFIHF